MKVIQEVISREVSKLNHVVMNKKRLSAVLFRKKTVKKKISSSHPS